MKYLFVLFTLSLAVTCGTTPSQQKPSDQTSVPETTTPIASDVSLETFKSLMKDGNRVLLDVRTPEEVAEGAIAGAINIDYLADDFETKVNALDKEREYLVYCRSGGRSGKAMKIMEKAGFHKIYNLTGGYMAWTEEAL